MSRIFLTGDIHSDDSISKFNTKNFIDGKELSKNDYVIILGDFGLVWSNIEDKHEKYWLNWLNNKPWTTLFVDGNHENFNRLNSFGIESWNGGDIQKIRSSIFRLMRGQVFSLHGKKFFTIGGANSHDKERRTEFVSWWREEIPSLEELRVGIKNLEKHDNEVDYILTHCAPYFVEKKLFPDAEKNGLTSYLDLLYELVEFEKHYCGHYHIDEHIDDKILCLYDRIIEI